MEYLDEDVSFYLRSESFMEEQQTWPTTTNTITDAYLYHYPSPNATPTNPWLHPAVQHTATTQRYSTPPPTQRYSTPPQPSVPRRLLLAASA